jgi:hypothetical protein
MEKIVDGGTPALLHSGWNAWAISEDKLRKKNRTYQAEIRDQPLHPRHHY